jgi:hypothetical protein
VLLHGALLTAAAPLFKKRGSPLVYDGNKVGYGTIPGPFRIFGKVTARKFPAGPVIVQTFTADTLLAAVKGTGTAAFVLLYITGFCHCCPPAKNTTGSFLFQFHKIRYSTV